MQFEMNPEWTENLWKQLQDLYDTVEWEHRELNELQSAVAKSSYVLAVTEGDHLLGFGRTMDDGRYYALICDVMVHPEQQGRGIGKKIMQLLREQLTGYYFITLSAAPGKGPFYEKIGWRHQSSAYIWPINEKQEKSHCFPESQDD